MIVKRQFCNSFYTKKGKVRDNNFKLFEFVVLDYLRKRKLVGEAPATTNDIDKSKKLISKKDKIRKGYHLCLFDLLKPTTIEEIEKYKDKLWED